MASNLPWMHYGGDFGANRWRPGGGIGQPDRRAAVRAALGRLAGQGVTVIRWFVLADGRAGLRESPSGELIGLDDFVLRDADAAIEELDRAGLRAIFVLFDFHFFKPLRIIDGVAAGGRGVSAADPALRSRLLQQVITPLLDQCGRHPCRPGLGCHQRAGVGHAERAFALPPVKRAARGDAGIHPRDRLAHPRPHVARRHGGERVDADAVARRRSRPGCLPGALVRPPREAGPARVGRSPNSASTARSSSASSRPAVRGARPPTSSRSPARPATPAPSPGRRLPTMTRPTQARWRRSCPSSRRTTRWTRAALSAVSSAAWGGGLVGSTVLGVL